MIGHYLMALTQEEEDRVLMSHLARAPVYENSDGCRCLVGVVKDVSYERGRRPRAFKWYATEWDEFTRFGREPVGKRFDVLCVRFGEARVNAAIRNRILTNRLWRELRNADHGAQGVPQVKQVEYAQA